MRLRIFPASCRFVLLAFICCTVALVAVFAASSSEKDTATAVDADAYKQFMSTEVFSVNDLDQWFVDQQYGWLPIIPPDENFILRQPSGEVLPFDWRKFPPEFVKGLTARYLNSVPSYSLTIVEDPTTRQTLFFNEDNQQVFALAPAPGYDPLWFLKDYRPELFSGHYTPWYVDFMSRFYDPSRVQVEITLIPSEYSEYYLYAQQLIAQEAATLALASGSGGSILMRYDGPPVTNICFTAIERTNGVRATIAYPYNGATYPTNCFTNRLDVFTSSDLLESWWDLAVTTNVSPTTNWIEWSDASITNPWATPRFYAAGNADLDSDGDGFADAREMLMYHSDPNNSTSKPVSVSGSVSYSGTETGTIYALATTASNGWSLGCSTAISGPGAYSNGEVATLRSYWFKAFRDVNTSHARDSWEPWGIYSSSSTYVTSSLSGVNITLSDVPTIWGTISYTGSKTGNVYVIAVTASNSWDTTYSCMIPWVQGDSSMTGGASTYLTFPVGYSITGLPASNYWIRAFIDSDTNLAYTHLEAAGQYTSNAIPVSNRVTGVNFTLDQDSDADQMPDWWEWQYGFNPADSNDAALDRDNDGAPNWKEFLFNTNPDNPDSDGDGIQDGWEIRYGLTPTIADATNDIDSDGLNNLDEYRRGTDPNDPDSDNDLISDGTNSLTGIFAGPDPNPLIAAPGSLPQWMISAEGSSVVVNEDLSGRPIVAWRGNNSSGKQQVYVMEWFGSTPPTAGSWAELDGMWEAFGPSAGETGVAGTTNGISAFDMTVDTNGWPAVAWSETRGGAPKLFFERWCGTNWVEISGSGSTGLKSLDVGYNIQQKDIHETGEGFTNDYTYYASSSGQDVSLAVDRQSFPYLAYLRSNGLFNASVQVIKYNGTNWTALGISTNPSGISGVGYYYCPKIALGTNDAPMVAYWENFYLYVRKWDGTNWVLLGASVDPAGTAGNRYDFTIDRTNAPQICWAQLGSGLWLRRFNGTSWAGYGGSDSGLGLLRTNNSTLSSSCQTLWLQTNGDVGVLWVQESSALLARLWSGTNWAAIGSSLTDNGVNPTVHDVHWAEASSCRGSMVVGYGQRTGPQGSEPFQLKVRQYLADSDGDGLGDVFEQTHGLSSTTNDTDSDGLTDGDEWLYYGTSATTNDTDGDGLTDAQEIFGTARGFASDPLNNDTDGDGILDGADLFLNSAHGDQDGDGIPDSIDTDDDNDGLSDAAEAAAGTDPLNPDTDGDGVPDGIDTAPLDPGTWGPDSTAPVIIILEPEEGATL